MQAEHAKHESRNKRPSVGGLPSIGSRQGVERVTGCAGARTDHQAGDDVSERTTKGAIRPVRVRDPFIGGSLPQIVPDSTGDNFELDLTQTTIADRRDVLSGIPLHVNDIGLRAPHSSSMHKRSPSICERITATYCFAFSPSTESMQ
jgi:hypothetical protein